jgi:uncharacterized protein involved in exopolysaccharide biosynthesis
MDRSRMSIAYWLGEIPRRAARWAAEDAAAVRAREAAIIADRDRRAVEWPVERIRALMTEARP